MLHGPRYYRTGGAGSTLVIGPNVSRGCPSRTPNISHYGYNDRCDGNDRISTPAKAKIFFLKKFLRFMEVRGF